MLLWFLLLLADNDGPGNPIPDPPAVGGYRLRRFSRSNT
jgi:hypothetical protein